MPVHTAVVVSVLAAAAALPASSAAPSSCNQGAVRGQALTSHNLDHASVPNESDCAALCCKTPRCEAWTFVSWDPYSFPPSDKCTHGEPCCFVKSAGVAPYPQTNCTSWTRKTTPPARPPPPPQPQPLPTPLPDGGGACNAEHDCTYGGVCTNGYCVCDPQWTGVHCAQLHLLPARVGSGYPTQPADTQLPTNSTFTWGGAVISETRANGTLFHGFFTEWMEHCPMTYGTWSTQTHIRHAVSSRSPDGPWEALDVPVPDAAGNPVVSRAPDGTYLLYFTNHRWTGPTRNCSGPVADWSPAIYCSASGKQCGTGVSLAYSSSLNGPWRIQYDVIKFSCTNPGAPVFTANGSLLMAYKTWGKAGKCISLVEASSWRDWPYSQVHVADSFSSDPNCVGVGRNLEDPSNLWRDRRGNLHMLFHQGTSQSPNASSSALLSAFGGGTASADGGTRWDFNGTRVAYEYDVGYEDGSVVKCTHREEPKVLLDAEGQPTMLITQCTLPAELPNTAPTKAYPSGEAQYLTRTVMQPINSG